MSYYDDESSDVGLAGQSKLESFLFSTDVFTQFSGSALLAHTWVSAVTVKNLLRYLWNHPARVCSMSQRAALHVISNLFCLPGCELSSKVPFYTFQGDEEEDLEHFLELRTVCTVATVCTIKSSLNWLNHFQAGLTGQCVSKCPRLLRRSFVFQI